MGLFNAFADFLNGPVGNGLANDPADVQNTKRNLDRVGFFDEDTENDFMTQTLEAGIRDFQRSYDLREDGTLFPGGETERAIFRTLERRNPDLFFNRDIPEDDYGIGFGTGRSDMLQRPHREEPGRRRDPFGRLDPVDSGQEFTIKTEPEARPALPGRADDRPGPITAERLPRRPQKQETIGFDTVLDHHFDPLRDSIGTLDSRPLIDILHGFREDRNPDKRSMAQDDPLASLLTGLSLNDPVGNNRTNNADDVTGLQRQLAALGLISGTSLRDPTGILDRETLDGVKNFQRLLGLNADGLVMPAGETAQGLSAVSHVLRAGPLGRMTPEERQNVGQQQMAKFVGQATGFVKGIIDAVRGEGSLSDKINAFAPVVSLGLSALGSVPGLGQAAGIASQAFGLTQSFFTVKDALDSDAHTLEKINRILPAVLSGAGTVAGLAGALGQGLGGSIPETGVSAGNQPDTPAPTPLNEDAIIQRLAAQQETNAQSLQDTGKLPVPQKKPVVPELSQPSFDLKKAPTVNLEKDRIDSLLHNTPAKFEIKFKKTEKILNEAAMDTFVRDNNIARETLEQHSETVEKFSKKHGVDPDLVKAIMWDENARGDKWGFNRLLDPVSSSQRPMNINGSVWSGLIGKEPGRLHNPEENIEASVILIKRIGDRIEKPTPGKIASIWHFVGRENTDEFGNDVDIIYNQKPWTRRK